MKDQKVKLEEIETSHTLGGVGRLQFCFWYKKTVKPQNLPLTTNKCEMFLFPEKKRVTTVRGKTIQTIIK
jgi:hypothetical protein